MRDANLTDSQNFPAAGATASATAIDLGAAPGVVPGNVELEVAYPTMAETAAGKYINFFVEDSADNVTFATSTMAKTVFGTAVTGGVAAGKIAWRLPKAIRRYVRISVTVEAAGGDMTGYEFTQSLVVT